MKTTPAPRRERPSVLGELQRREPVFHRLEPGATRAGLEAMTDPEICEIGASGRRYGREDVLALSRDTYLVTYTLLQQKQRVTRRSSIWRRSGKVWQVVYHQGTVVED